MDDIDLEKLFGHEFEIEYLKDWSVQDIADYLEDTGYGYDPYTDTTIDPEEVYKAIQRLAD